MFKQNGDFEKLCLILNYQFRNKALLAQAITTKSAWHHHLQLVGTGHHEEMAFLGDGILRLVVDKTLLEEFPYFNVGTLSKARDLLVKNINLSEVAKKITLEQFIIMDTNQIKQCQQGHPKLLADTVEAIIYAIYKDSGENFQEVKKFIFSHSSINDALEKQRAEEEQRYRPILFAIQAGDVEQVQAMLEKGFPPNFIFREVEMGGWVQENLWDPIEALESEILLTPLEEALNCLVEDPENTENMLRIIESLLKHGANPTLHAKGNIAPISRLFSAQAYHEEGHQAQYHFTRYQQYKDNKNLEKYLEERSKMSNPKLNEINWKDHLTEMFCRFGVRLDEENYSQHNTLLQLAIIHKQDYKVDLLLKYKINPNIQNKWGETALHLAALLADEALTIKLINAGADPTIANKNGVKPFDVATRIELKQMLLKAEIIQAPTWNSKEVHHEELKQTAMKHYQKWLSQKSLDELIQAIHLFTRALKHKLNDRNIQDIQLVYDFYNLGSAYFQRLYYVKAKPLLERAYILYLMNEQQFQPKTYKYRDRLTECEKFLEQNKPQAYLPATVCDSQDLTDNALHKSEPIISEDKQVKYNNLDQKLFSAIGLHGANLVKRLLKEGANPEAVSETEGPALHYAIQRYVQKVLMIPLADPYLGLGFQKRDALQIIEMLLAFGADPNQCDTEGRTALHIAAIVDNKLDSGSDNIIGLLLKQGADPNLRDHSNNFAAHYAKYSSRCLILNALLSTQSLNENKFAFFHVPINASNEKLTQVKASSHQNELTTKNENQEVKHKMGELKQLIHPSSLNQLQIKPVQTTFIKSLDRSTEKQYKTTLCKFFKDGKPDSCTRGDQCKFAHGATELKM